MGVQLPELLIRGSSHSFNPPKILPSIPCSESTVLQLMVASSWPSHTHFRKKGRGRDPGHLLHFQNPTRFQTSSLNQVPPETSREDSSTGHLPFEAMLKHPSRPVVPVVAPVPAERSAGRAWSRKRGGRHEQDEQRASREHTAFRKQHLPTSCSSPVG